MGTSDYGNYTMPTSTEYWSTLDDGNWSNVWNGTDTMDNSTWVTSDYGNYTMPTSTENWSTLDDGNWSNSWNGTDMMDNSTWVTSDYGNGTMNMGNATDRVDNAGF